MTDTLNQCDMTSIIEQLRGVSEKHKKRVDKAARIAHNMKLAADAAAAAAKTEEKSTG